MDISVSEAKAVLTDLVRRAELGEDIVLTRHGKEVARLVPVSAPRRRKSPEELASLIREIQEEAARTLLPGPDAAHSADFLHDGNGLPA
jgi:prevent-host-death family protein